MWRRFQEIPGVTSVGASSSVTMGTSTNNGPIWVEDFPVTPPQLPPFMRRKLVTEDYFETMQNSVLAGRPIEWSDAHDRASVVVVTANFAEE